MDWAFVEVDPGRIKTFPYNTAPTNLDGSFKATNTCLENGKLAFGTLRPRNMKLNANGMRVARFTRFGKATYESVGERRARLSWFTSESEGSHGQGYIAHIVPHDPREVPFGGGGDSGSWVLNAGGRAVGSYFAYSSGNVPLRSYIIDMEEILSDIEKTTNWKVSIANRPSERTF
ncbi:hypothetical protein B0O99DRAFT_741783 [Bisporella sp. PMI_857]|nr:hypothetical protein B0O99DRAFT_741783 [Bisporella sp. PMI_857]